MVYIGGVYDMDCGDEDDENLKARHAPSKTKKRQVPVTTNRERLGTVKDEAISRLRAYPKSKKSPIQKKTKRHPAHGE